MSITLEINGQNGEGNTLLHLTVNQNDVDNVRKLLSMGADVDIQNNCGFTPLHVAILNNEPDIRILRLLKEYNADPNICDFKRNWNCMHIACFKRDLMCIKFLADNYIIDLDVRDVWNRRALQYVIADEKTLNISC